MALTTEKLYYRRGGTTYSINLYTATSDVGSSYIQVRVGGNTRYAPLGATGDSRASYLRVCKGGTTYAVLSTAMLYAGTWMLGASPAEPAAPGNTKTYNSTSKSASFTREFDYNTVYSASVLYNLKVTRLAANAGTESTGGYAIDGTWYNIAAGATLYFRLSSGSHTIACYWDKHRDKVDDSWIVYGSRSVAYYC